MARTIESAENIDINKIRRDFPILSQTVHDKPLVYFDNAATSQKPQVVIQSLVDYYSQYNANVHRGVHHLSELATHHYEAAREKIRNFINAKHTREMVFLRGTTEAINLIAQTYGHAYCQAGDEILITEMEHHSNIVPWQILRDQLGIVLKIIPINDAGEIDIEEVEKRLSARTKLVSIIHVSNALGSINPIKEVIELAHTRNIPVLVDGAQAAPHMQIDVQALDCDFYTISGHKMFGPTGIGALYGKEKWLTSLPPYHGGGEMIRKVTFDKTEYNVIPHKYEAGTQHIAGAIALGHAIDYLENIGLDAIARYEYDLLKYATQCARDFPGLTLVGTAKEKASILSFTLDDIHAHDIGTICDKQGIAIRTGHHCAMPLMQRFGLAATARASFAFYNTHEEVDRLFAALLTVKEIFNS